MPTINQLTSEQLEDPRVFQKIDALTKEIVHENDTKKALALLGQMKMALAKITGSPRLLAYQKLRQQLVWVAYPALEEAAAAEALEKYLSETIVENLIDVQEQLTRRLFLVPLFPREALTVIFRSALEKNREKLGETTVGEWLKIYNEFQDFTKRNNLSSLDFFNQSQKAGSLTPPERAVLKKILDLYDKLLLVTPVVDPEELERTHQETLAPRTAERKLGEPLRQPEEAVSPGPALPKTPGIKPGVTPTTAPDTLSRKTPPPPPTTDRYREPVEEKDLRPEEKYRVTPPEKRLLPGGNKDGQIVNPLNVVDLRGRERE